MCRRREYLDKLHSILEPWAVHARRELLLLLNGHPAQEAGSDGGATVVQVARAKAKRVEASLPERSVTKATVAKGWLMEITVADTMVVKAAVAELGVSLAFATSRCSDQERKK